MSSNSQIIDDPGFKNLTLSLHITTHTPLSLRSLAAFRITLEVVKNANYKLATNYKLAEGPQVHAGHSFGTLLHGHFLGHTRICLSKTNETLRGIDHTNVWGLPLPRALKIMLVGAVRHHLWVEFMNFVFYVQFSPKYATHEQWNPECSVIGSDTIRCPD
jgi:hypothetical protein